MPPLLILLLILGFTAANVAATIYLTGVVQMKLSEVAPRLAALGVKIEKVRVEVQKLKDAVNKDPDVSQEVTDQFVAVETALGGVDDINEDEPTDPPADPAG